MANTKTGKATTKPKSKTKLRGTKKPNQAKAATPKSRSPATLRTSANKAIRALQKKYTEILDREEKRRRDIHDVLYVAYRRIKNWCRDGIESEIELRLRNEASSSIHRRSSIFLVLLQTAFPEYPPKNLSRWAAALEYADRKEVEISDFKGFLMLNGGVEGTKKKLAVARRKKSHKKT